MPHDVTVKLNDLTAKLKFIYDGGASKRYHTVDTQRVQDIAAHSFGVAWLCEMLTVGLASKNLIMAALAHDLAEHVTGDMPSPVKRAMGVGKQLQDYETKLLKNNALDYEEHLTEDEKKILKMADNLDGMLFCLRERRLGNRNVEYVYNNFFRYICEMSHKPPTNLHTLLTIVNESWKELIND